MLLGDLGFKLWRNKSSPPSHRGTRIIFAGQLSRRTKKTAGPAGNNVRFNCRAPAQVKLGERSVKHLADESGKVVE